MFVVSKTDIFMEWLADLRDDIARNKILVSIKRIEFGNLGDHHAVGGGVSEIRINYANGYRLYYTIRGKEIILLLCGGTKDSQQRDIRQAKEMIQEI